MKIIDALLYGAGELKNSHINSYQLESRILLAYILNHSQEYLLAHQNEALPQALYLKFIDLIDRRKKQEPIAYIIGYKEFFSRVFFVNKNVLIPRSDSEILIEAVIKNAYKYKKPKILELGCGSGCLIVTLALEIDSICSAIDIDSKALSILEKNAIHHGVSIDYYESNWFSKINTKEKFDIIISNPPYISKNSKEIAQETLIYEPSKALFAENNGLSDYENIAQNAAKFLSKEGSIYLEIGYNQENEVIDLYQKHGFILKGKYKDLSGYVRCLEFTIR